MNTARLSRSQAARKRSGSMSPGGRPSRTCYHRHITQCGQQHRADRLGVLDLGSGIFGAGPQCLPHDLVREHEVMHPQFVDHVPRGIGFVQHQPDEVGVVGNRLLCRLGDTGQSVQSFGRRGGLPPGRRGPHPIQATAQRGPQHVAFAAEMPVQRPRSRRHSARLLNLGGRGCGVTAAGEKRQRGIEQPITTRGVSRLHAGHRTRLQR